MNASLACITSLLLFQSAISANAQNSQSGGNNWSGTITYIHTQFSHHAAPYSEFIYHKWDHNYEQRMEAKVVNGKGTATSSISLVDTSLNRDQTGNRTVEQWEITKGNAHGAANIEVSINIDPEHKTYSIEVPIPATSGNKTKTFLCKGCGQAPAEPVTSGLGEDETSIMLDNEKLGADPNVLSGEKTERTKIDNGEGEEVTITLWRFTKSKR